MARRRGELLSQRFFARDAETVARRVLGKHLRLGAVVLRITETEAYLGEHDTAAHARFGRTPRTAPLFGPPGHAYVYLCYGLHWMLNFVTGPKESGAAILIRACEPIAGTSVVQRRRGGKEGPVLLTGPGKVAAALAVDRRFNDHPLFEPGGLEVLDAPEVDQILSGPRVGIDFASPADRAAPLRFAVAGTSWITAARGLLPR